LSERFKPVDAGRPAKFRELKITIKHHGGSDQFAFGISELVSNPRGPLKVGYRSETGRNQATWKGPVRRYVEGIDGTKK